MNPKVLKGEFIRYLIFCCYFCRCCSENSWKSWVLSVGRDLFKGTDAESSSKVLHPRDSLWLQLVAGDVCPQVL